jgi:NAD(P)H-nitrite reductase large subunit
MVKYLIIGGSVSSVAAVEAIRTVDPEGSIAVVTEESSIPYSRPLIGDFLCGAASLDQMQYRSQDFWIKNNVRVYAGKKALQIDFENNLVEMEDGEKISYTKLLLATGSKPFIPKIEGTDKRGVYQFVKMNDVEALKQADKAESAVVLGGGLIGVCIAEALHKKGLKVTIVELQDHILNMLLDSTASTIVEEAIQKESVKIVTGHTVKRVEGRSDDKKSLGGVVLDNEESIPCDILIIAIGVRPRLELVKDSSLKLNRGILVDRNLRTNLHGVYASGDVAEAYDFVTSECAVLPQWPTAYLTGRVAGLNMAGEKIEYYGGAVLSALKYFGTPVIAAGQTNPQIDNEYEFLVSRECNAYKKLVLKDGVIKGFILVNEIENAGTLYHLMKTRQNVDQFKSLITSKEFSVASLPEPVREQMIMEVQT